MVKPVEETNRTTEIVVITPAEEKEPSNVVSKNSSKEEGDSTDNSNSNKIDSNLIVMTSGNGKIEDIISPIAVSQKKPYQDETSEATGDKTNEKTSDENVDANHLIKDQPKSTTVKDPISSKLSQTSLKRRKIPPPLGITPTTKKSQQRQQQQIETTATTTTQQQAKKVSKPQVLQRPRVQYLGKIHPTGRYSQTATTPYFHNRMRYGPSTAAPPPPQQQQPQIPPLGFPQPFPPNGLQSGIPPHPMGAIPPLFPTSTTPYMTPSYYYPYTRMAPNPTMIPQTATTATAAYGYPYPTNTIPDYLYREDSMRSDGSDFSIKRQMSKSPMNQETKEAGTEEEEDDDDEDGDDDDNDDDEIEGSDLAIEEGAVPTPIFTRFPQEISSDNINNMESNVVNGDNDGLMFGEIRIQDNRYSFEFPQRNNKELNKKIFMSICNQIWNECDK